MSPVSVKGEDVKARRRRPKGNNNSGAIVIAPTSLRRIAAGIISEMSPNQSVLMRPCVTTTAPAVISSIIGDVCETAYTWNTINKLVMLTGVQVEQAFRDYCRNRGGVWNDVYAEYRMIVDAIVENKLPERDEQVMLKDACTPKGMEVTARRIKSSAKAMETKAKIKQQQREEARASPDDDEDDDGGEKDMDVDE